MKEGARAGGLHILPQGEMLAIHEAGLALLENPGVFCESKAILDILKKNDALVDSDTGFVRIGRTLVENAFKLAPKNLVLYGRDPAMDLSVRSGAVFYGLGGTPEPFYYDYELGHARAPTKADMEACTRVGHALSNIDFVMTLCTSGDVPIGQGYFHDLATLFRYTSKPIVFSMIDRRYAMKIIEMGCAVSGGEEQFRKRPLMMALVTPVSPLIFPKIAEGIIDAVEFGMPVLYSPGPMLSGTAPATLAGLLSQTVAEILFGLVVIQMIRPGAPLVFKMDSDVMDPSTGQCTYSSPEQVLGRSFLAQLGRFYNIPTFTMGGGVEAKLPDAEASGEAMMGMLMNGLAGITLSQSQGTLASGLYGSAEQLVICDEMVHMIKKVLNGFAVNTETIALDVIRNVKPGGSFIMEDHTLRHFREEHFFPTLFRRQSVDDWLKRGAKPILDTAHERVEEIKNRQNPVALSAAADAALERALQKAACP